MHMSDTISEGDFLEMHATNSFLKYDVLNRFVIFLHRKHRIKYGFVHWRWSKIADNDTRGTRYGERSTILCFTQHGITSQIIFARVIYNFTCTLIHILVTLQQTGRRATRLLAGTPLSPPKVTKRQKTC